MRALRHLLDVVHAALVLEEVHVVVEDLAALAAHRGQLAAVLGVRVTLVLGPSLEPGEKRTGQKLCRSHRVDSVVEVQYSD